jgi:hypothetical protein
MPNQIVPDYYHIDFGDGMALRVLLREHEASGDMPYVELFIPPGFFRKPVDSRMKTVENATLDLATELQSLADSLRRMAPRLLAPMESP